MTSSNIFLFRVTENVVSFLSPLTYTIIPSCLSYIHKHALRYRTSFASGFSISFSADLKINTISSTSMSVSPFSLISSISNSLGSLPYFCFLNNPDRSSLKPLLSISRGSIRSKYERLKH